MESYNINEAKARTRTDWKKDVPMYIGFGTLIFLVALAGIFGPDMIEVLTTSTEEISAMHDQYERTRHDNAMREIDAWEKAMDNKCVQVIG